MYFKSRSATGFFHPNGSRAPCRAKWIAVTSPRNGWGYAGENVECRASSASLTAPLWPTPSMFDYASTSEHALVLVEASEKVRTPCCGFRAGLGGVLVEASEKEPAPCCGFSTGL